MPKSWTVAGHLRFAIGCAAAVLLITFALTAGRILVVDAPQPSDLILVLAGETDKRPALALELLRRGYGKRVLIDVPADSKVFESSELDLAQKYIRDLPDSASVSICPIRSLSTQEETGDVEKCLTPQDGARILIVTSDFHTLRALSIFRHELRGKSFSVAAAHDPREFGSRWWTHREWAKTCAAEWVRTIWWNAVDRWR
ncbi:MAG TPA: YdcF family protein [Nitrospiraceae bacterium]|nr:YdcF family protein [Nitrospiraceae bacterium]